MNIRRDRRRLLQTLLTSLVILFQLLSPLTVLAEDLVRQAQTPTAAALEDTPPPASEQPPLSPEEAQAAVMRALQDLLNVPPDAAPQVAQLYRQALDDAMARYAATVQSAPADSARPAEPSQPVAPAAPSLPAAVAPPVPADTAAPGAPQAGDEAFLWYMEAQPDAAAAASPQAPAGEQGASWLLLAQPEGDKARFDEAFSRLLEASLNEPASASPASSEPAPAEAALLTPDTPPQARAAEASGSTPWHRSLAPVDEHDWAVEALDAETALLTPDTPPQARAAEASGSTPRNRSLAPADEDDWAVEAVDAEAALLTPDTPPQPEASEASGSTPWHRSLADEDGGVNGGPSYAARADHSRIFILATDWDALIGDPGPGGTVRALAHRASDSYYYVGGGFGVKYLVTVLDPSGHVIRYEWHGLGNVSGTVHALAVVNDVLHAGGDFGVKKWNGSSWVAMGNLDSDVYALAVSGSDVYAGGDFAGKARKWNGSSWSALGTGPGGTVYAVTLDGETLYAGGGFGVERWNGSSWVNVGIGSPGATVYALAVAGEELYAGGGFFGNLARWDGSDWYQVLPAVGGTVRALAANGGELYVGGDFASAGGNADADYVARWNGVNTWTSLGQGTSGRVSALMRGGGSVYVGGDFDKVDGAAVSSNKVGRWAAPTTNLRLTKSVSPNPVYTGKQVDYTLTTFNNGSIAASNVSLRDTLPEGFTFDPAKSSSSCTASGRTVTCVIPFDLTPLMAATLHIYADVDTEAAPGIYRNVAVAGSDQPEISNGDDNVAAINVTVQRRSADLALSKSAPTGTRVGSPLTYNITVTNAAPTAPPTSSSPIPCPPP